MKRKIFAFCWDNEEFPLFIYQLKDNVNSEVYEFDYKSVKNAL